MSSRILLWGEEGCPLPTQPQTISERRTFRGPSLLRRKPELCCSVPSCPYLLWPPFLQASASSSRKARGCQLMAEISPGLALL